MQKYAPIHLSNSVERSPFLVSQPCNAHHLRYDPVGNRLSLTTHAGVVNYAYDAASRLTSVNGQAYTWDNNGNPSTSSGQACSRTACAAIAMTTPIGSPRS